MYEGQIKAAGGEANGDSPILRQLRWTDLVARLAATRGIREPGEEPADDQQASFTAFHLEPAENGQRAVNRDALTHGKFVRVGTRDAANNADQGDREI